MAEYVVAFLAATAVSYEVSERQADRQEEAQEELQDKEQAIQGEQAARQRRAQIQKARIAQSQIENVGKATGASNNSAAMVAQGNVSSQAGSNIGAINRAVSGNRMLMKGQEKVRSAGRATFGETMAVGAANYVSQGAGSAIGASLFSDTPNTGDKKST